MSKKTKTPRPAAKTPEQLTHEAAHQTFRDSFQTLVVSVLRTAACTSLAPFPNLTETDLVASSRQAFIESKCKLSALIELMRQKS